MFERVDKINKKIIVGLMGEGYRKTTSIEIKYNDGRLSICGNIGSSNGGQCYDSIEAYCSADNTLFCKGYDAKLVKQVIAIWRKWHLNDMHAECKHQEELGITYNSDPNNICPVCGYKIGTKWTSREVPQHVLMFLNELPEGGFEAKGEK